VSKLPVARPRKIVCVGLNYRDHIAEAGFESPARPIVFAKWTSCLIGPGEPIRLPLGVEKIDYEGELGVVIGATIKNVPIERALEAVRGYVCFNDVSARELQVEEGQWTRAKSLDTFGPIGRLTPSDEIADPQGLGIRTWLNGEVVQDSNTSNMIFSVAEVISYLSSAMTLEDGDLIATGTPGGVGFSRTPPRYLEEGDVIRVEIDGLQPLSNPVQLASPSVNGSI
jgi:2,4-didehydro-3-deoxy-L-rhamnonate hydrolase